MWWGSDHVVGWWVWNMYKIIFEIWHFWPTSSKVTERKNGDHFFTLTSPQNGGIDGRVLGRHPVPFLLFFYKVYLGTLTPSPSFCNDEAIFLKTLWRLFFPLNMIPWYLKQIWLHCEEAEKLIFDMPQKTFSMPISCCQSPPEYIKSTT